MTFLIADAFSASLARLTPDEQASAKATAFDLQQDRTRAGMSYHALAKAKDPRFASVRVNDDLRVIVHRTPESLLLCYVGHHDDAYRWAERRKLEAHPTTGAMQMVEVRERVERVVKRVVVPEAADALLTLAVGEVPEVVPPAPPEADPFAHPAAQRRFRVVDDVDALATALDAPWEQWAVFLHPSQRDLVERDFGGPARVSGSTGRASVATPRSSTRRPSRRSSPAPRAPPMPRSRPGSSRPNGTKWSTPGSCAPGTRTAASRGWGARSACPSRRGRARGPPSSVCGASSTPAA